MKLKKTIKAIVEFNTSIRTEYTLIALYKCEFCNNEEIIKGDNNPWYKRFMVIKIKCSSCGKSTE